MTKDFQNYFQDTFNHKDYKNTGNLGQQPVPNFVPSKLPDTRHATSPSLKPANNSQEIERTWPGTAANPPLPMPEKSLLTREQLVRLNKHLPDKDKIQLSPEEATMSLHNSPRQAPDLSMTDAEAAQVLAHHTASLETEAEETTRWLNEHGVDTSEGIEVDIEQAMRKATADGQDMFDQVEKIKIVVARRASAVLVLRALSVAAMHTDATFKGMITEAAVVAKAEPRRGIFDVGMGVGNVEEKQPSVAADPDAMATKETGKEADRADITMLEDELETLESLVKKQRNPLLKDNLFRRIDDLKACLGMMRRGLGQLSPVEVQKLANGLKDLERSYGRREKLLLKDKVNVLISKLRAQQSTPDSGDDHSNSAKDNQHKPDVQPGHEAWFEGQRFKRVGSAKREMYEVLEEDAGEMDALLVSEVRRKRQRRHGTGASQDDPVIL